MSFTGFACFILQKAAPESLTFGMTWWAISLIMYAISLSFLMCDAQDKARIIRQNNLVDKS